MIKQRFRLLQNRSAWTRALLPGLHIKRWILLLLIGVTVGGLGLAFMIRELYISHSLPPLVYIMALTFLPDWVRGILLLGTGFALAVIAVWRMNHSILVALLPGNNPPRDLEMIRNLFRHQLRRQGPKVVAIGGGTGMPQLLRGLRQYTDNITAIVTVADDGGSSGRLRQQMGLLPPGDFRNNIAALSEAEDLMTRLFQYRFAKSSAYNPDLDEQSDTQTETGSSTPQSNGLAGHSFGNLFIATMAAVTGSFETALAESSRVLAVRGRVLPSTLEQIQLCAEIERTGHDGRAEWLMVQGESKIPESGGKILRVFLEPENPHAYPSTIQAILQADLIVAGPGSFYTSVMPNLLVPAIRAAICASTAPRIYICNVATQAGETDSFSVSDHMEQLRRHAGDAFTTVLANANYDPTGKAPFPGNWVTLPPPNEAHDYRLFTGDLVDPAHPWRHDPVKLAATLMEAYAQLNQKK